MTKHNELLQSMRGIAALMVLFGHAADLAQFNSLQRFEITFFEAHSAVIFFFVLSGFVLGDSLRRFSSDGSPVWFARYAVARGARLLPVFWLSTIVGAGMYAVSAHTQLADMGAWFYMAHGGPWTWPQLIQALTHLDIGFNGALWSVRVEFWMVVLLPPMVFISRRVPVWTDFVIIFVGCAIGRWLIWPALSGSQLAFVCYAYCFYVGVALPKIVKASGDLRSLFFSGPIALGAFILVLWLQWLVTGGFDWGTKLIIDGLLSAVIVAWGSVAGPSLAKTLLTTRPLVWLGDISYSFYAYGQSLLILTALIVVPLLPVWMRHDAHGGAAITTICPLAALAILLPAAALSYRYVEKPGIRLGTIVTRAIASLGRALQKVRWRRPLYAANEIVTETAGDA